MIAPILAVEFARRSIPGGELRPSFKDFEAAIRSMAALAPRPRSNSMATQTPAPIIIVKNKVTAAIMAEPGK